MTDTMDVATEAPATTPVSGAENAPPVETPVVPAKEGEETPAESAAPKGAPEKYELKAPESYPLDEARLQSFEGLARELGLTQEGAQKLIEFAADGSKVDPEAVKQAQIEERNQRVETWVGELKADKDFGKDFDGNVKVAQKALADFGDPALSAFLKETGLGSHPGLVQFFHRVGKGMGEGSVHKTSTDQPVERSLADRMYPNYSAS